MNGDAVHQNNEKCETMFHLHSLPPPPMSPFVSILLSTRCNESKLLRDVSEYSLLLMLMMFLLLSFFFSLLVFRFVPAFEVSRMRWKNDGLLLLVWILKHLEFEFHAQTSFNQLVGLECNWQAIKTFFLRVNEPQKLFTNYFERQQRQQRENTSDPHSSLRRRPIIHQT